MRVLLVGGAGYIGSHTAVALAERGHDPVILDDLSASSAEAVRRVERLSGRTVPLVVADAAEGAAVEAALRAHAIEAVVLLAGRKSVGESVAAPLEYYRDNLGIAVAVLSAMRARGVARLVFSSSATVYEEPRAHLVETDRVGLDLANPYGRTKLMIERIVADAAAADPTLAATTLRYFNPVGAHPSGLLGEDPGLAPSNLLPNVAQVAVGVRDELLVLGDDFPTRDGTGVRDYVHVVDLAEGHVAALERLAPGVTTLNLGTGVGATVREVVAAFERATGRPLPVRVVARRPGDAAEATADASRALAVLGWRATRTLGDACADVWRWQRAHPRGYDG